MRKLILFMLLMFGIFASMASASVFQFINESGTIQLNINMLTGEADFAGVIKESGTLLSATYIAIGDESNLNVNSTNLWDTLDSPANIPADTVPEASIVFSTACAAGNHYYLNGNDLACEADDNTQLSEEQVEDFVGTMLGGTETHISVTYVDGGVGAGLIDFVVSDDWWDALGDMSLTSAYIYVGTAGNIPAGVAVTGDITMSNTGVVNIVNAAGLNYHNITTGIPTCSAGNTLSFDGTDLSCVVSGGNTTEQMQDAVMAAIDDGTQTFITVTYQDATNDMDFVVADNWWNADADISADEISESKIAFSTACAAGNHYYLSGNDLACEADANTQLNKEQVQDFAWDITGGTQTGITVTYQDGTDDVDFEVTDLYVNTAGDTMTGDLNMSGTDGVITSSHPGKIIFNATGVFIIA